MLQNIHDVIPVYAPYLVLTCKAGDPSNAITVWGTNRYGPSYPSIAGFSEEGLSCNTGSIAMVAGNSYSCLAQLSAGKLFQGPAFAWFRLAASGGAGGGMFQAITYAGAGYPLCDTNEMHAQPDNNKALYRTVAIPANVADIQFVCQVAGTIRASLSMVPQYA
jgi:hypothetical protein